MKSMARNIMFAAAALLCAGALRAESICGKKTPQYEVICGVERDTQNGKQVVDLTTVTIAKDVESLKVTLTRADGRTRSKIVGKNFDIKTVIFPGTNYVHIDLTFLAEQ